MSMIGDLFKLDAENWQKRQKYYGRVRMLREANSFSYFGYVDDHYFEKMSELATFVEKDHMERRLKEKEEEENACKDAR